MKQSKLNDRKSRILQIVIHHYIKTAKPVGSKIIAKDYGIKLSTATIRNVLSDLENGGYLTHPYTSAGRIPTDRGYRSYVDALEKVQYLTIEEMDRISNEYQKKREEHDEILRKTTHMLSMISSYAGFVMVPKLDRSKLKHIELVSLEDNRLLIVLITENGMVRHKVMGLGEGISAENISKLAESLNKRLPGLSLDYVKNEIVRIIEDESRKYNSEMKTLKSLFNDALDFTEREMYLESPHNILDESSYENYSQIRAILEATEEKKRLSGVLQSIAKGDGVKVLIGGESYDPKMKDCSMVTSTYRTDDKTIGVLGIIGPKRMQYSRMISLVDYVSGFINKLLRKS